MGRLLGIGVEQMVYLYPDCPLWASVCQSSEESCINPGLYAMVGAAATLGSLFFFLKSFKNLLFILSFNDKI